VKARLNAPASRKTVKKIAEKSLMPLRLVSFSGTLLTLVTHTVFDLCTHCVILRTTFNTYVCVLMERGLFSKVGISDCG
jgi:hypothetical protein